MSKNVIRLEGDACYEITLRGANLEYKKGSKLEGQHYSRYSYEGIIFNVNESMGFREALKEQDLATVKLIDTTWQRMVVDENGEQLLDENGKEVTITEKGFEFDSFTRESDAFKRQIRNAKHQANLGLIAKVVESDNLSEETVKAVLSLSV
jgi:hypothetical protein